MNENTDEVVDPLETDETNAPVEPSSLEMSDEDFLNAPDPAVEPVDPEGETGSTTDDETVGDTADETTGDEPGETDDTVVDPDADPADPDKTDKETDETDTAEKDETVEHDWSTLKAPFKANGKDMTVKSPEDARTLMQMGANYHKKMAGLKPSLSIVKLLEKHELLDPEKINYLIDLNDKNPEAITKLLKDSNIDPLDVDVKADSEYTPKDRTVSDTEFTLDSVLEDIQDSPSYSKTLNVVSEEWDRASRNSILEDPTIIATINGHIENGIYGKVEQAVNYERSLGRLKGLSDIEAYNHIGAEMHKQGKFNSEPEATKETEQAATTVKPVVKKPTLTEAERLAKKLAVSPTKSSSAPAKGEFNPLLMSDEEFLKFETSR
ncbi:MAG: hypothetical protein PF440_04085 [Thiomicrorhabdus sp.]|jgi:hypothetical protein|nr:hypothetical protein [Thiomicrorhabdus sp.]